MIFACISIQMILLMFVCVYQHTKGIGDASVCLSAFRLYWWWLSISRWRIFMMFVYLSAYRWSWCCPASAYEQSTADSFRRYIAHLIFGNSDRGRLLNPMFFTKKLGTIGYQFLISNFRRVLYVVYFLLGNSPASEFYMPTFRNILSVPSSQASR
jgi:hypothetical protein